MGREISEKERLDEAGFKTRLREETRCLMSWFKTERFERPIRPSIGLELEAWLMDENGLPAPRNLEFLDKLDDDRIVPELAAYNFEFNADPLKLEKRVFSRLQSDLTELWRKAEDKAEAMGMKTLMTGIPATLRETMLRIDDATPSERYRLLNERLFMMRGGQPLKIDIAGREELDLVQTHLMMEAACTSLQVHLMMTQQNAARRYNAAQIASAPLVAASANSPYLYGRRLWEETRIAAFESALDAPGPRQGDGRRAARVTFGRAHVRDSLMELFLDNLDAYEPFLPMVCDTPEEKLEHLRLQNGTVWRWNRPIVQPGETPHLRVESRVMPAGPTLVDIVANTAFCIGLTLHLEMLPDLEERLPFEMARRNFYACAKEGYAADCVWLDGRVVNVQALIRDELADAARDALIAAGIDPAEAGHYIGIVKARSRNGQNGAAWQRAHANCHGNDHQKLVLDYIENQKDGAPVHRWRI